MFRARVARSTPVGGNREIYASYEVFFAQKRKEAYRLLFKRQDLPPHRKEGGLKLFGRV